LHDGSLLLGALGVFRKPFAGSGSTLAAAEALGYLSIGADRDQGYYAMARSAFGPLSALEVGQP
jgi:DNA modification methylase